MCRAKSDPQGGFRCMPPSGYLVSASDGSGRRTSESRSGAYWLENTEIPTLDDIKHVLENTGNVQWSKNYMQDLEDDFRHLGHMINLYSDSKVRDFDSRLKEIQSLAERYEELASEEEEDTEALDKLSNQVSDLSLALGSEVRASTMKTLSQVRELGGPLRGNFKGHKELVALANESTEFFPTQWNDTIRGKIILSLADKGEESSSSSNFAGAKITTRELKISNGEDGHLNASSLKDAEELKGTFNFSRTHEMVHELTHIYEKLSPDILDVTNNFYWRRVAKDKSGNALPPIKNLRKDGWLRSDHFAALYIGHHYRKNEYDLTKKNEIFSRGTESVFLGANGSLIGLSIKDPATSQLVNYNPDIEHRDVVLGLLAKADLRRDVHASVADRLIAKIS